MKRVIVTGATGAIGSALVNYLSTRDMQVYAICRPGSKRISAITGLKNVRIVEADLSNLLVVADKLPQEIDVFYHLGWQGTERDSRDDIGIQIRNINNTLEAVELADKVRCTCFIGAGSQAEYGRCSGLISSSTLPNPELAYGAAKLCAGQMSRILCHKLGIRHIWARFFSVYGPNNGKDSLIISTILDLLHGKEPSCTEGKQIWDYMYSFDAAEALYLLGDKGIDGKTYCVGNGKGKSIREYVEIIRNMINPEVKVRFGEIPYSSNQPMKLLADITDLERDTGFKPKYTFEEGIGKTIEWIKTLS